MKPFRTIDDLTAFVAQHAPSNACARAISENRAIVLGGFNPVEGLPSYIVHVCSYHGKEWIIAVLVDEAENRYRVRYLEDIPWDLYIGTPNGKRPMIDGEDHARDKVKCLHRPTTRKI